jgi:hypothetical protein
MKNRTLFTTIVFLTALSVPTLSIAAHDGHHEAKQTSVENLSPELRALLQQEMQALQNGMIAVIPAFVSGDLKAVEEIAKNMKDSFILRQSITREQMHELHSTLPESFIEMDKEFHYFAGMLSHTANRKKLELVNFYLSKLTESCVACHSQYATHKFPGFLSEKSMGEHDGKDHDEHQGKQGADNEEHDDHADDDDDDDDHDDH